MRRKYKKGWIWLQIINGFPTIFNQKVNCCMYAWKPYRWRRTRLSNLEWEECPLGTIWSNPQLMGETESQKDVLTYPRQHDDLKGGGSKGLESSPLPAVLGNYDTIWQADHKHGNRRTVLRMASGAPGKGGPTPSISWFQREQMGLLTNGEKLAHFLFVDFEVNF